MSMPDVAPPIIHESAIHMPSHGIACVGGNIDEQHEVYIVDLIRKRRQLRKYITKILLKIRPDLVGLTAMAWQYDTCIKLIKLIKLVLPEVKREECLEYCGGPSPTVGLSVDTVRERADTILQWISQVNLVGTYGPVRLESLDTRGTVSEGTEIWLWWFIRVDG